MQRIWKMAGCLFLLSACCFSVGVGSRAQAAVKIKKVTAVSNVGTKTAYVAKGKKVKLTTSVSVKPDKKGNKKLKFRSANKKIAAVSRKGVVKGKKAGKTKIIVTSAKNKKKKAVVSVRVMKKAVKKVAFAKSSVALPKGESITLKAKVTASKGASKRVYWKSSNRKVAAVTQKGVIQGAAMGTAKITATAADGSGKKAACTVTVTKPANSIMSLQAYNPGNRSATDTLRFSLTQAQALTAADIVVKTKSSAKEQYKTSETVLSAVTSDSKTYILSLKNKIENGTYILVSVNCLTGSKSMEIVFQAKGKDYPAFICANVGEPVRTEIKEEDFRLMANLLGRVIFKHLSGVMPKGLSFDAENRVIAGTPDAVADNKIAVILGTDENGTWARNIIYFLIGDAAHIYAENKTVGDKADNRVYEKQDFSYYIRAAGGSGTYRASLINDYDGMFSLAHSPEKPIQEGVTVAANADAIKEGTYDLEIKFEDAENPEIVDTGKLKVIVSPAYAVGNDVTGKEDSACGAIYYQNEENGRIFACESRKDGVISGFVPAGTYLVYMDMNPEDAEIEKYILGAQIKITGNTKCTYAAPPAGENGIAGQ